MDGSFSQGSDKLYGLSWEGGIKYIALSLAITFASVERISGPLRFANSGKMKRVFYYGHLELWTISKLSIQNK